MEKELYAEMAELEERHWWFVGRRAVIVDMLKRYAPRRGTLLDIGLGTGANALQFIKLGFEVTGVEFSSEAIALARQKVPGVPIIQTMFPSDAIAGRHDVITLFDVLEHFEDDTQALRSAANLLKPGGKIFLTVPAFQFLWTRHDELAHHVRRYRKGELASKLKSAGFKPQFVSYYNFFLFPAIALVRVVTLWLGITKDQSDFSSTPSFLNVPLAALFGAERYLLRCMSLPFGVSLIAVAQKNENPA